MTHRQATELFISKYFGEILAKKQQYYGYILQKNHSLQHWINFKVARGVSDITGAFSIFISIDNIMYRIKVYTDVDHTLQLLKYFENSRVLQEGYILHDSEYQLPLSPSYNIRLSVYV